MKLLLSSIFLLLCSGTQLSLSQSSESSNSGSSSGEVIPPTCIDYQCDSSLNVPCEFDLTKVNICEQGLFCMPGGSSSESASTSESGSSSNNSSSSASTSESGSGSNNSSSNASTSESGSSSNNSSSSATSSSSNVNIFGESFCVPKVDIGGKCRVVIGDLSNCFEDLICLNGTCQEKVKGTLGINATCEVNSDCASGNCLNQTCQSPSICIDGIFDPTSCPFGQFLQCNSSLQIGNNSACVDWFKEDDECDSSFQCSYDMICSVNASDDDSNSDSQSGSNSYSQSGSNSNSQSGSNSQSYSNSNSQSGSQPNIASSSVSSSSSPNQRRIKEIGKKYCRKQFTKKEGENCSLFVPHPLKNATIESASIILNRMDCDLTFGLVCSESGVCVKLTTGADCSTNVNVCSADYEKCICEKSGSSSSASSSNSNSNSGNYSSSASNSSGNSSSIDLSSSASNSNSGNTSSSDLSSSASNSNSGNSSSSDFSSSGSTSNNNSSSNDVPSNLLKDSNSNSNNSSSNDLSSSASNSNSGNSSSSDLSSSGSNSNSNSSSSDLSSSGSNSNSNSSSSSSNSGNESSTAKCVPIANYNSECQDSLSKITKCALENKCNLGVPLTNSSCLVQNCIEFMCTSSCFSTPLSCTKVDICRLHYSGSSSQSTSSTTTSSSTTTGPSTGTSSSDSSSSSLLTPSILIIFVLSIILSNL